MLILVLILLAIIVALFFKWGKLLPWLGYKTTFFILICGLLATSVAVGLVASHVIFYKGNRFPGAKVQVVNITSDDTANFIKKTTLIVGVNPNINPWVYLDDKQQVSGFNIEVLNEAAALMNKQLEFKVYSSNDQMYKDLHDNKIDIVANLALAQADSKDYSYSVALSAPPIVIVANSKLDLAIPSLNDTTSLLNAIKNNTIIIPNSVYLHEFFAKLPLNNNLITVKTEQSALDMVNNNANLLTFVEYFSARANQDKYKNISILKPILNTYNNGQGLAYVMNNNSVELCRQLNIALSLLKRNGKLTNLSITYFKQDITM